MAMVDTITIEIDASSLHATLSAMQRKLAASFRNIPVVEAADGTKWADITDLLALADRLEQDADNAT
jgi:hypothetical protein